MKILVIAEFAEQLKVETLKTIAAANQLQAPIDLLLLGTDSQDTIEQAASVEGVSQVLTVPLSLFKTPLAEPLTECVLENASQYSHILAPATTFGKNLMPRIAARLDVMQSSDVIEIVDQQTIKRPIYAGNAIATVRLNDPIKVMTVRSSAFDLPGSQAAVAVANLAVEVDTSSGSQVNSEWLEQITTPSERPELSAASVVVSGGRGMQSKDNFALIEQLADKLNAAIGASRAAVDAGFVSNDLQVGQTGKIVAPDLYIAVGISGAIQHLAGMKDSKVVVAINKDQDAPIFQVADYGLVADLFEVLPELTAKL